MHEFLQYLGLDKDIYLSFLNSIKDNPYPTNHIDSNYHVVWVNEQYEPDDKLKSYLDINSNLPLTKYYWTNIDYCPLGYEKKNIDNLFADRNDIKYVYDCYYNDKKYVFCSDIVRLLVLYEYGGIYADHGIVLNNFTNDLLKYDYLGLLQQIFDNDNFFQNCIIGVPKKSPIIENSLKCIENIFQTPKFVLEYYPHFETYAHTGVFITMSLYPFYQYRIKVLYRDIDLFWESRQSWYKTNTTFGNTNALISAPSVLK